MEIFCCHMLCENFHFWVLKSLLKMTMFSKFLLFFSRHIVCNMILYLLQEFVHPSIAKLYTLHTSCMSDYEKFWKIWPCFQFLTSSSVYCIMYNFILHFSTYKQFPHIYIYIYIYIRYIKFIYIYIYIYKYINFLGLVICKISIRYEIKPKIPYMVLSWLEWNLNICCINEYEWMATLVDTDFNSHEDLIVPITNGVCLILQKNELYPHREWY